MLCAAWTLKNNEHVRIDIVSNALPKRWRDFIDLFGHLIFMFPFLALMLFLSTAYFKESYASGEVSSSVGGLLIWPAKGLILLGFFFLSLQWLSELIKRIAIMRGDLEDGTEARSHGAESETANGGLSHGGAAPNAVPPGNDGR